MNVKNLLALTPVLTVIAIAASVGCAASAPTAQFAVDSLSVKPSDVSVGEQVSVSARVTNTGGSWGVYSAALSIEGQQLSTKSIELDPGAAQTVTFTLSRDTAGIYSVGLGGRSAMLTVRSKLVAKQVELGYDSGVAKDYLALAKPATGYVVGFISPHASFSITQVRVFGLIYGSSGFHIIDSDLKVLNKDMKVLYTTPFAGEQFPLRTRMGENIDSTGGWEQINIPNVEVSGSFYIHIYTGIPAGQGFRMGATSTPVNTHSDVTIRGDGGIDDFAPKWPYAPVYWYGDMSRVNWMVRVVGDDMVPPQP